MDTNISDEFVSNFIYNVKMSHCCEQYYKQSQNLEKALEKEKKKRKKVENAFRQLLIAYNSIVDAKKLVFTSDESEVELIDEKENLVIENSKIVSKQSQNQLCVDNSATIQTIEMESNYLRAPKKSETVFRNRISVFPPTNSKTCFDKKLLPETNFSTKPPIPPPLLQKTINQKDDKLIDEQSQRGTRRLYDKDGEKSDSPAAQRHVNYELDQDQRWYFIALDNEKNKKDEKHQSRVEAWLKQSTQRTEAIAETSRRRAIIASNRRIVAIDILRGSRKLDEDALQILHTDSSTISSFPEPFMRKMRSLSKKMVKTFWVVRHAEREDNINRNWIRNKNPRKLMSDNSPLSKRGKIQADELGKRFANVNIDHVFASSFDRTIETATRLIGEQNIPIKSEPGLVEALYLCNNPPGFQDVHTLKNEYPLVDLSYEPLWKLPLPNEDYGDDACIPRLKKTLNAIIEKYPDTDSIVLVGHGASIGAIHEIFTGKWNYVGQATVSKFTVDPKTPKKFKLQFSSDASHLSDKSNLRSY